MRTVRYAHEHYKEAFLVWAAAACADEPGRPTQAWYLGQAWYTRCTRDWGEPRVVDSDIDDARNAVSTAGLDDGTTIELIKSEDGPHYALVWRSGHDEVVLRWEWAWWRSGQPPVVLNMRLELSGPHAERRWHASLEAGSNGRAPVHGPPDGA